MTPPPITFFIDRCLGSKKVAFVLREAGLTVEIHEDHFAPDALDIEWLLHLLPIQDLNPSSVFGFGISP